MVIFHKFLLIGFILMSLTQCNNKQGHISKADIKVEFKPKPIFASALIHPTSYIGKWSFNFPFYTSELLINDDGTFKFNERGCTGRRHSEGKWRHFGTNILLTSLGKYSTNEPLEVIEGNGKHQLLVARRKKTKGEIEYTFDPSVFNTTVTYKFGICDTTDAYFDDIQLRLDGDTLFRLDNHGHKTNTKYIITKNNR